MSYSPYSTIQPSYGSLGSGQSNVVVLQSDQSNIIAPSSYGSPLSCVCSPNTVTGLGSYGSGLSVIPTTGYTTGQSQVFTVPGKNQKSHFKQKHSIYSVFFSRQCSSR